MTAVLTSAAPGVDGPGDVPRYRLRDADDDECALFDHVARERGFCVGSQLPGETGVRVATCQGQVVGVCSVRPRRSGAQLDYLFVYEAWRNQGVGRTLVEDIRASIDGRGLAHIDVAAHPPDEQFYRRVGAYRVGTRAPGDGVAWSRPLLRITAPRPG